MKISLEDTLSLMQALAICNYVNDPIISRECSSLVVDCANKAFMQLIEELSFRYNFDPDKLLYFNPLDQEITFEDGESGFYNYSESSINLLN